MRFTPTRGAAALLLVAIAAPAWAQTTGSDTGTSESRTEAPAQDAGAQAGQPMQSQPATPSDQVKPAQTGAAASDPAPADAADSADAQAGAEGQPAGDAAEGEPDYAMGDIVLGDPDAPLTVVEYASFTCPHCGTFAEQTFPEVKEKYIDTGKVKFVLREVYFDQYGLWASMVARCGGEKGFYPLAETFLTTQATWTRAPDIGRAIHQVGRRAGLSAERLEQCLSDRDYAKELLAGYQQNMEADNIKSTPTFIIAGEQHTGAMSFDEFSELLDANL